ncbi:MAG: peptide deformylase [Candidatus Margulisbacteria bacterium]|nr:peptide deformylase [Candidatus Margulisiibacteriota bacterium]
MSSKKILIYNNPLLRKKSKAVKNITPALKKLVHDMADTMYENNGAGLAAIQIGELTRIFILDISEKKDSLQVFINPRIVAKEGEIIGPEACLSVPKFEGEVRRGRKITLKAKDIHFEDITVEAENYLARVIQHELDHLDGVLYIDKVEQGSLKTVEDMRDM